MSNRVITLAGGPRKKTPHRNGMSAADVRALRTLAPLGMIELRRRFPDRTPSSIRGHAVRHGIKIGRLPYCKEGMRGKHPIPKNCHPLVKRLFVEMNQQGVFLHELSDRCGVTRQAMSKWRYCVNPSLTGLIAAFNCLGLDLAAVQIKEQAEAA